MTYPFGRTRQRYRPPPRPPIKTPVAMRKARAGMDADPSGDRPTPVVDDAAANAVARLLGWTEALEPSPEGAAGTDNGTLT